MKEALISLLLGLSFGLLATQAEAQTGSADLSQVTQNLASKGLRRGTDLAPVSLNEILAQIRPGSVLVLGENHENSNHQAQQLEILQGLRARGLKVNVGMEFLTYTDQAAVDAYVDGQLSEDYFLKAVQWGATDFRFYRDQILFPRAGSGRTYALNAPRVLSGQIARGGLSSLNPDQIALLPPNFSRGSDAYFERFMEAAGGHLPDSAAAERYFLAQSLWDDTMAWRAHLAWLEDPQQVLVIVVGEFHVQYGGGLPDRLRARGLTEVHTLSQLNVQGLSESEVESEVKPHSRWGPRADYLWLSE